MKSSKRLIDRQARELLRTSQNRIRELDDTFRQQTKDLGAENAATAKKHRMVQQLHDTNHRLAKTLNVERLARQEQIRDSQDKDKQQTKSLMEERAIAARERKASALEKAKLFDEVFQFRARWNELDADCKRLRADRTEKIKERKALDLEKAKLVDEVTQLKINNQKLEKDVKKSTLDMATRAKEKESSEAEKAKLVNELSRLKEEHKQLVQRSQELGERLRTERDRAVGMVEDARKKRDEAEKSLADQTSRQTNERATHMARVRHVSTRLVDLIVSTYKLGQGMQNSRSLTATPPRR
jgi:regulator of replication initiation timing